MVEVYDSFTHKGANQNWWLAQAHNGLIYNGTGTGINEWDGEQWQMYFTPQKSRVRSLSIWKDDNIYIGTSNDIGFFYANTQGSLTYQSLLKDWTFEEKQLGEVWSTAANNHGVMFLSNKYLLFWDGHKLQKIDALLGSHRIFSVDDVFYFKSNNNEHLYSITIEPNIVITQSNILLDKTTTLRKILKNNNQNLTLITSKNGLYEIIDDKAVQRTIPKDFPKDTVIYNGIQAHDGYYYLSTLSNGVLIVDPEFNVVKNYKQKDGLGTDTFLSVLEDFQGDIWFSGVPNIVKMIPPHHYSHYLTEINSNATSGIKNINNKVTIIGDGIHQFSQADNPKDPAYFKLVTKNRESTWDAITYKNHLIYAGINGVYASNMNRDKDKIDEHKIIQTKYAKGLAIDEKTGTLFATSEEGLFSIRFENNTWLTEKIPGTKDELHYIEIDKSIIWAGTSTQELYKVENIENDNRPIKITKFTGVDGLGENNVMPFKISQGVVIATNDGLMDYQQNRQPSLQFMLDFPKVFHTQGLDVFRLYEDKQNKIWYRIGNRTGYINKNKNKQWQIHEDLFRYFPDSGYKGFTKTEEKILWFSMANGDIFRANTDLIEKIPTLGKLNIRKITNLDTQNEIFGGLGNPHIPELTQDNNSIRIQYALADNSVANAKNENQIMYRHRLLGSSSEKFSQWTDESHNDFTLLRGNDYQFEVEAKDAWGRISKKHIRFVVLPPWYLSTIAWIVYAVLALLILIVSSWLTQKWRTAQLNLRNKELETQVKERTADVQAKADELKQQQQLKDRFFTNVSHEFRTPLTLTIAPLQAFISDNKNLDNSLLHPIKTALKNSKKMLSLVGQVLDINRLESGRFPLRVAQYDIADLINTTAIRFQPLIQQHLQNISVQNTDEPKMLYCDIDQIDKCLSNIISNAIKYSGDYTSIIVSIIADENFTGIKVSDNGKGISPEFENKVFQRFTQDEKSEQITEPGTGIGLALVKELMELHHGRVELINHSKQTDNNTGCEFILWLNNDPSAFKTSEIIEPIAREKDNDDLLINLPPVQVIDDKIESTQADITTLLVVDDNQELREFIAQRLSTYYRIIQAENGQEGFSMAQGNLPDLIISDVMMPILNGLQMIIQLKDDPTTQDIPIILLTAKSSKRETVEGLQTGADDYLSKPFDTSELITRVAGIINNRKKIRESVRQELSLQNNPLGKTCTFIEKLRNEILNQLSDPNLSVESLSETMAMSRFSLNRKCKQELNKTTRQLITETRMHQALSLLKLKQHSVSEIAYGTGFDSLAYFSRVFKKHYGKTPSDVQQAS